MASEFGVPNVGLSRFKWHVHSFLMVLMLAISLPVLQARAEQPVETFTLDNGMDIVVITDNRAPVVTHMVWYRVGAADEPRGVSGIAHFLEHLMFKSTEKIPMGEFSKIVARLGGQDNAFTSQDATVYFQRIAKERLGDVMAMEADRMVNLRLTEKEVLTERNVILEERRSRIENNPSSLLAEQMDAALYLAHPYGIPIIGWMHEMAELSPKDAMDFYKLHYAPNNAILVVAGDVSVDEVRKMAEATYGKVARNDAVGAERKRVKEPPHLSPRRLELKDPRAGKPSVSRYYLGPSYKRAEPGEAEALEVLMKILASGSTSRLYRKAVVEDKVASNAGGWYAGDGFDSGKIALYGIAADGSDLDAVEARFDEVIAKVQADGVTDAELNRAKSKLTADYIYESDSQSTLARRYGWGLVVGRTIADIEAWPENIRKVTSDDVKAVAVKYLDPKGSVTGRLLPIAPGAEAKGSAPASATSNSRG